MTDINQLIERLRVAVRNSKATILGDQISATLGSEAAAMLEAQAAQITDLQARLRIAEKAREDAEALRDFLLTEMDRLIEKARQS